MHNDIKRLLLSSNLPPNYIINNQNVCLYFSDNNFMEVQTGHYQGYSLNSFPKMSIDKIELYRDVALEERYDLLKQLVIEYLSKDGIKANMGFEFPWHQGFFENWIPKLNQLLGNMPMAKLTLKNAYEIIGFHTGEEFYIENWNYNTTKARLKDTLGQSATIAKEYLELKDTTIPKETKEYWINLLTKEELC